MHSIFYHATPFRNLYSISHNGIKPSDDGTVKLCRTVEDAVCFGVDKGLVDDGEYFIILSVLVDTDEVKQYQEHSLLSVIPLNCFKYKGAIPSSRIALDYPDIQVFTYRANQDY